MKHLTATNILLIAICFIFAWLIYATYLKYQPFRAPELNVTPFKIVNENKQVRQGEALVYELDYCSYKKVPTENSRRLEQQNLARTVIILATSFTPGNDPGCSVVKIQIPIDENIAPGRYKVISTAKYQVNEIKEESKVFESEEFEIIR